MNSKSFLLMALCTIVVVSHGAIASDLVNVTICGSQPKAEQGLAQCTKDCQSFVLSSGSCTAQLGLNQTITCGPKKVKCYDFDVFNSDNCDPDTAFINGKGPCNFCDSDHIFRCMPDSLEPYHCNEKSNCTDNCTRQARVPIKKCTQVPDRRHPNATVTVLLKRFYECRPVTRREFPWGTTGCSGEPLFETTIAEGDCTEGAYVNNSVHGVRFQCLDSGAHVDKSSIVDQLPDFALRVLRGVKSQIKKHF